jgi:hypothetical protein
MQGGSVGQWWRQTSMGIHHHLGVVPLAGCSMLWPGASPQICPQGLLWSPPLSPYVTPLGTLCRTLEARPCKASKQMFGFYAE